MARVLGERYLLESVLGTGGMARVYLALDQRLGRKVAVKVMAEKQGANRRAFYFQREARSIAALKHSGIVQIYDFSGPDENPSYIVEELLEGVDADQVLEKNRKIDPKVLVVIAHSMAAALAHAHSQGVIHRDIKPSNVMLERSGRVVLTDFGIAKAYKNPGDIGMPTQSTASKLMGTPSYMSPEQIRQKDVGPPSDVFSLGSLLYSLATGLAPFGASEPIDTMRKVLDVNYIPWLTARGDLPPGLVQLGERCMVADPAKRPKMAQVEERLSQELFEMGIRNVHAPVKALLDEMLGPLSVADSELEPEEKFEEQVDVTRVDPPRGLFELSTKGQSDDAETVVREEPFNWDDWADFDNKVPQADVLKKEESPKEESKEDKATSYSPRDKTVPVERHLSGATRGNSVTTQVVIASAREAVLRVQTQFDWAWGLVGVLSLTVMVLLIIIFI